MAAPNARGRRGGRRLRGLRQARVLFAQVRLRGGERRGLRRLCVHRVRLLCARHYMREGQRVRHRLRRVQGRLRRQGGVWRRGALARAQLQPRAQQAGLQRHPRVLSDAAAELALRRQVRGGAELSPDAGVWRRAQPGRRRVPDRRRLSQRHDPGARRGRGRGECDVPRGRRLPPPRHRGGLRQGGEPGVHGQRDGGVRARDARRLERVEPGECRVRRRQRVPGTRCVTPRTRTRST